MTESRIATFFTKEDGRAFEVNEGTATEEVGYSLLNGNEQKYMKFANPCKAESLLVFDFTDDYLVKPAEAGDEALFISMYDAEWRAGKRSAQLYNNGYHRMVTAYKLREGEIQLPLSATNSAISAGDFLVATTYNGGLDLYTSPNDSLGDDDDPIDDSNMKIVQAVEDKAVNSGGYITCYLHRGAIPLLDD